MERSMLGWTDSSPRFSRRAVLVSGGLLGAGILSGRGSTAAVAPENQAHTWLLPSADAIRPGEPGPAATAEIEELLDLQRTRTDAQVANALRWGSGPAQLPWTELALDLIVREKPSPPKAARALALVHTALSDTVIAAEDARRAYERPGPAFGTAGLLPVAELAEGGASFPSVHAAVAAVAAGTLATLFPRARTTLYTLARAAAESRVTAGVAYRSDIEAGLRIGEAVAALATERAGSDGVDISWDGIRPEGEGTWQPTPPGYREEPLEPAAGSWRTWLIADVAAARPAPPPAWGSPAWSAQLAAVQDAVARRTPEQEAAVHFWAGGPGTVTPAGLWIEIARDLIRRDGLTTLQAAPVLAATSVALADAFICCWDTKFAYWYARPVTADPSLEPLIPTPPFPSYTSGHATISAAAAAVLAGAFPGDAEDLFARAFEAKQSRLWGGIHYPIDNDLGAAMGDLIGRLALAAIAPIPWLNPAV